MRIAICDDDFRICNQVEEILLDYGNKVALEMEIEVFHSGEGLISHLKNGVFFDLIYLDIEMKQLTGIEVGKEIRRTMNNYTTEIVYISGFDKYDRQLFEVQPLYFIPKPIESKSVENTLLLAMERSNRFGGSFRYKKVNEHFSVPFNDIIYFVSNRRKIDMVTTSGADSFYSKMEPLVDKLSKHQFIQINRSTLVNYKHIIRMSYEEVTMSNQTILPIARSKRNELRTLKLNEE